jgi:alanine dehydrogenase
MTIEKEITKADLVIGSVLIPGKMAPKLLSEAMVKKMMAGTVLVDVAIDQGGCSETSRPTTHSTPTYVEHGVVHYCVTNMPGACARTATVALTNATMPYALLLANLGCKQALQENPGLRMGLNVYLGHVTHPHVAQDLGYEYLPPEKAFFSIASTCC